MRFDPHPEPVGDHRDEGVLYAAIDLATALAEVYQETRLIDTIRFAPAATAWNPTRPLRLLNLDGTWALRNHAAHALANAPSNVCRAWARAIRTTWPELDGLWAPSTMTGRPNVVLWTPATDSFPLRPAFSEALTRTFLYTFVEQTAAALGYEIRTDG